jgi:hypothetical protein
MAGMIRVNRFALTLALILATAGTALAQDDAGRGGGSGGPLGVGVNAMLAGPFGPTVVYDTGMFHIEGILGFQDTDAQTEFDIAGRFWYHISSSQAADFSLGGGLGVVSIDPAGEGTEGTTDIEIDAGAQVRAFIVPNVAISASLGLAILTGDADAVSLTGDVTGSAGIIYFF